MPPSDIASVDVDKLVEELTTEEAILLTAGVGFWHTHDVSDGPNGIRGNHFFMSTPAKCLPSATALGATWDPELIEQVGLELLSNEAKLKAASVILAPTCNIQRNPLGGRAFESFSEDPTLSGLLAAAYIKGLQKGGIGTAIKHFVCNDMENDRMGYDSVLSERALREIYLMPFMLAQKYAKPWCFMTAYNRVNGIHAPENRYLLQDVLRKEWKFDGLIMSDWFGVYCVDHSINAGLDLEMPGHNKWRTLDLMSRSISSRKMTVRTIKERARKVIELVKRSAQEAPEILDGDGIERTFASDEEKQLMRRLASETIVLLKNDHNVLPLQPAKLKKVAIVGGNAKAVVLSGGGSASLKPSYFVSPYDGIVNSLPSDVEVRYSEGAASYMEMPTLDFDLTTPTGERGWIGSWYRHENDDSMTLAPYAHRNPRWSLKLEGLLKPRSRDCIFEFGLTVAGRAKLFVDGQLVIDNWTRQQRGGAFFGAGTLEKKGRVNLKAGVQYKILVDFCNVRGPADGDEDETVLDSNAGVRLGGAEVQDPDDLLAEAVQAAKDADVVIAVTLNLPGRTDELVAKVATANPNTVVVTQSGSSIALPWADSVPAIVHAWYLGNATGDAIADVLFGKKNPSGKLSLTFPKRLEDVPSHGHFSSENGIVRYAEDLFVGYKHYIHRGIAPLFAFGHGLSYTTFSYSDLKLSEPIITDGDFNLTASLTLTNTGNVSGTEVVQLYVSMPPTSHLTHPKLILRTFSKVKDLAPQECQTVTLNLDKYAVSYWDDVISRWVIGGGEYGVSVGSSSESLPLKATFVVSNGLEWNGL
ncbi:glycoside hydrolase family 3 protein [Pisolithus sp. B1]|nr:glycoside hydrolase family 3 protein [Pisolithus sp. B1]